MLQLYQDHPNSPQQAQVPASKRPLYRRRQRGVVTLELLLALPILLVLLLGIIELSLIYEVDKRVAYASRFGAKVASETTRDQTSMINLANLASSGALRQEINAHLANAGLTNACGVILQHNACLPNPLQEDVDTDCDCAAPTEPLPGGEPGEAAYVRVTVCLPLVGNVLDLLPALQGFSIDGATLQHSTLFRIEDDNQAPNAAFTTTSPNLSGATTAPLLPVSTPPIGLLVVEVPAVSPTTIAFNFNGSPSTDREEPLSTLDFAWVADTDGNGSLETSSAGIQFLATFNVPELGQEQDHQVRLTVTDSCLADDQTAIVIRMRREIQ